MARLLAEARGCRLGMTHAGASLSDKATKSFGARASSRVGAFFDMDKTLIADNSGSIYMKKRYQDGEIGLVELARGAFTYLRYKAGIFDMLKSTRAMTRDLKGRQESEFLAEGRLLCEEAMVPLIYPEAVAAVRSHQERGDLVCIVSGSMGFVVDPLAAHLGIEFSIFTQLETKDGRLTGEIVEPLCFGEGKVHWIQQLVEQQGIDLARSWFYTDSVTDRPLLDRVGHPVAVNPDPLLYRLAVRRGWPIRLFTLDESGSTTEPETQ
jgi:HAD superfamily hydrolase (TIGR01490 family)